MSASLFLASILLLAPLADEGDDRYHFISGLAEKGLNEMVVEEATRFLEEFPDHARLDLARYRLASALFDLSRLDAARPHFAALAGSEDFRFRDEVAFRSGQCELEAGDNDAAARAFERARSGEADYLRTSATFLLAEAHFRAERFARAAVFYSETLEAQDGGDHAQDSVHGLAWCAFRTGDHDGAIAFVATFLERWPGSERGGEMLFLSGESHLEAGRPKAALVDYLRVKSGTFHPAALRGAGFACAGLTDHAGAAAHFQALLAAYPESPYVSESALHGGIHLLKAEEPLEALVLLTSEAAGEDSEVLYWRGRTLAELGRNAEALAAFVSGLQAEPSEDLARRLHVGRGDALYDLGDTTSASQAFQEAGSDYALHAAAVARLNDGFPDEAAQLAAQLVDPERQSPYRLEAALTLAEAHFAQKHYDQAQIFFAVVAKEDEDGNRRARATTRMGWCRYLVADMQAARDHFELVNAKWPECPDAGEARFMAGRAAEEAGDEGAAAEAYALYLFDHAGETYGDEAAVRLARYEGGPEAEERLAQLLAASPESELVPQAHHDLAERLADRGQWASAREHYSAVVTNHPQHVLEPPARYGLAWCLFSEERFAESLGHLENLIARGQQTNAGAAGPTADLDLRIAALELAVWAARRAGEPDRARAAFASYSAIAPDETRRLRAARVAAAALKEADRIPDAEALLFELLGHTRDRAVAVGICVECTYLALDRGDVAAAEAQARAAHRYTPDDASLREAFFFVGEAHFEAGADEEAAACYSIAAESSDPDVASRALYKGGFAHLRRDEYDAAGRCFHALVSDHEASDLYGESLFLLGESHFRAGRYAQAVEWLERTRKEAPEHSVMPRALYRLGVAQARTQRWRDSAETLSLLAREHTQFEHLVEADLWRGRALAGLEQRRGARAAFERVIEKDRGLLAAQAHIELARMALAAGDRDEALSKFLYVAVLFAHPDEVSEALFMAGQILESKGNLKQAADRYREAVTQFPGTDFTRRSKARLAEIDQ